MGPVDDVDPVAFEAPIREGGADMHKPKPIQLTDRERTALRAIEDILADDDPELAALLERTPMRSGDTARRSARFWLIVITALSALVLIVADFALHTHGAMLLLMFLPGLWWCRAWLTRER